MVCLPSIGSDQTGLLPILISLYFHINHCPAEPRFYFFDNTVDPDQLASDEGI